MGTRVVDDQNSTGNELNPLQKGNECILLIKTTDYPVEVYCLKFRKHEFSLHLTWKLSLLEPVLSRMNFILVSTFGFGQIKIIYKTIHNPGIVMRGCSLLGESHEPVNNKRM